MIDARSSINDESAGKKGLFTGRLGQLRFDAGGIHRACSPMTVQVFSWVGLEHYWSTSVNRLRLLHLRRNIS